MKYIVFFITLAFSAHTFANGHQTIYTTKLKRIANALPVGHFSEEKDYFAMLDTACERNKCTQAEKTTLTNIGKQVVDCKIKHLRSHQIENSDATNICQSQQSIFGCDSLATPLLRKMCYSGNNFSLQVLNAKEKSFKQRQPASK